MSIIEQCHQMTMKINKSEINSNKKIKAVQLKLKELKKELENINQPSLSEDLHDLKNQIKEKMRQLKNQALNTKALDQMKVLEARQDITMWITRGEYSTRKIEIDINNNDPIRLKAWLSINQENLNSEQRFDRTPVEYALINSLFKNEQKELESQLSTIENAINTNSRAISNIDYLKSSIKSSGLA